MKNKGGRPTKMTQGTVKKLEEAFLAITKRYLKQYPRLKTIARTTTTLQSSWNVSDKVKSGTHKKIDC